MNRTLNAVFLLAAAIGWSGSVAVAAAPSFTGVGSLASGTSSLSVAAGVSADGQTVVGTSVNNAFKFDGFRWTRGGGIVALGVADVAFYDRAAAVNGDGSVIVGDVGGAPGAYRSAGGAISTLSGVPGYGGPSLAQYGDAVSRDGAAVVGQQSGTFGGTFRSEAYRWTAATGSVGLGYLGTGANLTSGARGTNVDGGVVVGVSGSTQSLASNGFRWTAATGMVALANPAGYAAGSANAVTAGGGTIVGSTARDLNADGSADEAQATRWVGSNAPTLLGDLPGGPVAGSAAAVSDDGNVVVGYSATGGTFRSPVNHAFLWTADAGMQDLNALLPALGVDLTGWTLTAASGVSADGTTIVGTGTDPAGRTQAWIAVVPEPTSLAAAVVALVGLSARRRRPATRR